MPLTALIFGILGASLALIIELVVLNLGGSLSYTTLLPNFSDLSTLVFVALIEESSRYLLLRQYLTHFTKSIVLSWRQTFFTGLLFGIGFAGIELTLVLGQATTPPYAALGIALVHITISIIFAFFLTKKISLPTLLILTLGIALHLAYNLALTLFY